MACADEVPGTFYTGNDIHNFCRTSRVMALGYVAGLNDARVIGEGALVAVERATTTLKARVEIGRASTNSYFAIAETLYRGSRSKYLPVMMLVDLHQW